MRFISGALLFALIAGCQPAAPVSETVAGEPPAVEPQAAPEAAAPLVLGGVDFSKPARALGTEPFWGVEIKPDELVFTGVDRPEVRAPNPGAVTADGGAVIATKDAAGAEIVITMRPGECSDGMSDRVYPLSAEVTFKGETLKGCAASQATLDERPRP